MIRFFWKIFFLNAFFFLLERSVFLVWNYKNYTHQPLVKLVQAFLYGIRFDASSLALLGLLVFLLAIIGDGLFFLKIKQLKTLLLSKEYSPAKNTKSDNLQNLKIFGNLLFVIYCLLFWGFQIFQWSDIEFIHFVGRRMTKDSLWFVSEVPGQFWSLIFYYWPLSIGFFVFSILFFGISLKIFKNSLKDQADFIKILNSQDLEKNIQELSGKFNPLKWAGTVFFNIILLVFMIRGGWQLKPLSYVHAQVFNEPVLNNLVLNSVFSFTSSIKKTGIERYSFYSNQQDLIQALTIQNNGLNKSIKKNIDTNIGKSNSIQNQLHPKSVKLEGALKNKNIIFLVLESFNFEYMGWPFGDKGYTPFLDRLAQKSLFFDNAYANGRRSIEGIAAIFAGVPALMEEPFISSPYMTNYFVGLGTMLNQLGYTTSFFHGAKNGTMYFDQFMKSAGVQNYYGLNEYPSSKDFDGTWGIYDHEYLPYVQQVVSNSWSSMKKPFMTAVFTLSSHNPFRIPDSFKGRFPKGTLDIHESIGYTDFAVEEFFKQAESKPWFKDTIFIITADHTYKNSRSTFENKIGSYRVPILFYDPSGQFFSPQVNHRISSQIDILSSLLYLMGTNLREHNLLAKNLFLAPTDYMQPEIDSTIFLEDKNYYLITDYYLLKMDVNKNIYFYDTKDWNFTTPVAVSDQNIKLKLEQLIQAKVQYFSQSMWDNRLYYSAGP